jgi:hypothetical protein
LVAGVAGRLLDTVPPLVSPIVTSCYFFRKIEEDNPYLLIAYVYHLYMGLFSGGQILGAKVFRPSDGSVKCF